MMDQQGNFSWNERIRQERIQHNWRQREVAERLGTTTVTVTRWERGSHQPSAYFRIKLCSLFGKSPEELGFVWDTTHGPQDEENVTDICKEDAETQPGNLSSVANDDPTSPSPTDALLEPSAADLSLPSGQEIPTRLSSAQRLIQRRKMLLLGATGGLGLVAAATSSLWFVSQHLKGSSSATPPYPIHVPLSQRSQHLFNPNASNWVNHLTWSPDNRLLAVAAGSNMLVVWNVERGAVAITYPTLNKWVNDVSWSKTNWIAAVTAEPGAGSLQLWKFPEPSPALTIKKNYALRSVCWSPDGNYLATSGHTSTVEVRCPFPYRLVSKYSDPTLGLLGITRVKWSPSGRFLACAADNGRVHVWEALTGRPKIIYQEHQGSVLDLSWSPDEQAIISCGSDQTSRVWSVSNGNTLMVYQQQKATVEGVGWSPLNTWVASASADQTVHIWAPYTRELIAIYDHYDCIVETVRWSSDGTMLAIGTEEDGVGIWPGTYGEL